MRKLTKAKAKSLPKVENLTIKQLDDLEMQIAKARESAAEEVKAQAKAEIDKVLDKYGCRLADLYPAVRRGVRGKSSKVAKFVNPDNSAQTWTGRGRKPNWLVTKLKKGAKLENFAV